MSEVEAGRRKVSAEELRQLAEIYGVDLAWVVGAGEDQKGPAVDRVHLAARELAKLKPEDLERVVQLLRALRPGKGKTS